MGKIKEYLKRYKHLYAVLKWGNRTRRYIKYGVYAQAAGFNVRRALRKMGIIPVDAYIDSLKDKHKGEKMFVIATGPSLTMGDLELIQSSGAITISMNTIYKIFDNTEWRPDYYVLGDYKGALLIQRTSPDVRLDKLARRGTLLSIKCKKLLAYEIESEAVGYFDVGYFDHWENMSSEKFKYDRDIRYGVYDFFTVANSAINIADYMGVSEIYLLGVDCNYAGPTKHIGEDVRLDYSKEDEKNEANARPNMIRGYEAVNRLKRDDLKIYNATRGGMLEVFPRITLEEALKRL